MRDYAGRRTYDTCYRARPSSAWREAILVTQRFHLPRALFTCRNLGVDGVGFSADRRVYWSTTTTGYATPSPPCAPGWDVKMLRPLPVLGAAGSIWGLEGGR